MDASRALKYQLLATLAERQTAGEEFYPDPSARIRLTTTFCFRGICRLMIIGTGMRIRITSVEMLRPACAAAMLLRQTPSLVRGLHGPMNNAVIVVV